jgi:peptidylprolyl isomerase
VVKDADGKLKLGDPQPFRFTEGEGRVIPGLDVGIQGMREGGKRRIIIPYQMAYGVPGRRGPNAAHPGVPPKADLIFDVDLLEVIDENAPPKPHPASTETKPATPGTSAATANTGASATPAASGTSAAPAATATPAAAAPATPPTTPASATPAAPAATPNPSQPQPK